MNKRIKVAVVIFLASAAIAGPIAHHHWKRALSTEFEAQDLPKEKGVNLFELGKLSKDVMLKDIAGLIDHEGLVLVKFTTEDDEEVSLLMRRTTFHGKRKDLLKLAEDDEASKQMPSDHVNKVKNRFKKFIGNAKELPITSWYRFNAENGEWHQLFTVLDRKDAYRFENGFNVRIFPNGLAVFFAQGQKPVIISATGTPVKVSNDGKRVAVGKSKEITGAEFVKDLGDVKLHPADSDELP